MFYFLSASPTPVCRCVLKSRMEVEGRTDKERTGDGSRELLAGTCKL